MGTKKGGLFGTTNVNNTTMTFVAANEQELQQWLLLLKSVAGVQGLRDENVKPVHYVNLTLRTLWLSATDQRKETALHILVKNSISNSRATNCSFAQRSADSEDTFFLESIKLAAWFIENGCPKNAVNLDGETALHCAISVAFAAQITVDRTLESPFGKIDADGDRLRSFHLQLINCLLIKGADVSTIRNKSGRTVLDELQHWIRKLDSSTDLPGTQESGEIAAKQNNNLIQQHLNNILSLLLPYAASVAFSDGFDMHGESQPSAITGNIKYLTGYSYLSIEFYEGFFPTWMNLNKSKSHLLIKVSALNAQQQPIEDPQISHRPLCSGQSNSKEVQEKGTGKHWGWSWHMHTPIENVPAHSFILIEILPSNGKSGGSILVTENESVDGTSRSSQSSSPNKKTDDLDQFCCWSTIPIDTDTIDSGKIQLSLRPYPIVSSDPESAVEQPASSQICANIVLSRRDRKVTYETAMESVDLV